ncbi:hypothetical protein QFC21_000356 [Naganishia friedmannii]|uniref:Uncharacterized protein n=1 Tax=Naganishia friedmannii TaxID=89922 RepID=A0ACC2WB91_9TREE|nr:hypothetical protein QFC21_000356 [Naganishia friedmannii]
MYDAKKDDKKGCMLGGTRGRGTKKCQDGGGGGGATHSPTTDGWTLPGASAAGIIGLVAAAPALAVTGEVMVGDWAGVECHRMPTATTPKCGGGGRRAIARFRGMRLRSGERRTLEDNDLSLIAQMDPQPWMSVDKDGHLKRLLVPRSAGSENNTIVREYIKSVFGNLGWHAEEDTFTGKTPEGVIQFTNLIFTFNPEGAATKLVMAAHHDSKWFPDYPANQFVGATDSAAPCAMLLDLAEAVTPALQARKTRLAAAAAARKNSNNDDDGWDENDDDDDFDEQEAAQTTLQFIFFDGEEAFHDWTATDSIYGSRHLAAQWESTFLPPTHAYQPLARRRMDPTPTELSTIEHLVLLDLLGAAQPRVMQWYKETGWLFNEMREADVRLRESRVGVFGADGGGAEWFSQLSFGGSIEDDQVPFIERGVNVLHVIPYPFPSVWHTINVRPILRFHTSHAQPVSSRHPQSLLAFPHLPAL